MYNKLIIVIYCIRHNYVSKNSLIELKASVSHRCFFYFECFMKDLYESFCSWITGHPISCGGILALILTTIRVALAEDKRSFSMVCLEAVGCGLLSVAFSYSAISMFHCDQSIAVLIGSSAGFIGIDRIKLIMLKIIDNLLARKGIKENDDENK